LGKFFRVLGFDCYFSVIQTIIEIGSPSESFCGGFVLWEFFRVLGFDYYFFVIQAIIVIGSPSGLFCEALCWRILLVIRKINTRKSTLPEHPYLFRGSRRGYKEKFIIYELGFDCYFFVIQAIIEIGSPSGLFCGGFVYWEIYC
jgi:hypothetical protein